MSKYTLTFDQTGETIGTARSVAAAKKEAEQFFQNGSRESVKELQGFIRMMGFATVTDNFFGGTVTITRNG